MDNTGKGIPPAGGWYGTRLAPEQEAAYRLWVTTLPERLRSDYDYDLRGAWLAGDRPDGEGHMTDRWKKPWHPTFSGESVYGGPRVQGGRWEGETFVPSAYNKWVRAFTGANEEKCGGELKKCGGKLYADGGGIHIKKENRGKFTAAANRAGMGVQAYARHVLANKGSYSPTLVKRANFARNAAKWHADGGNLFLIGGPDDPPRKVDFFAGMSPMSSGYAGPAVVQADKVSAPAARHVAAEKAKQEAQIQRENYMNSHRSETEPSPGFHYPTENEIVDAGNAGFVDNTRGEEGLQSVSPTMAYMKYVNPLSAGIYWGAKSLDDAVTKGEWAQLPVNLGLSVLGLKGATMVQPRLFNKFIGKTNEIGKTAPRWNNPVFIRNGKTTFQIDRYGYKPEPLPLFEVEADAFDDALDQVVSNYSKEKADKLRNFKNVYKWNDVYRMQKMDDPGFYYGRTEMALNNVLDEMERKYAEYAQGRITKDELDKYTKINWDRLRDEGERYRKATENLKMAGDYFRKNNTDKSRMYSFRYNVEGKDGKIWNWHDDRIVNRELESMRLSDNTERLFGNYDKYLSTIADPVQRAQVSGALDDMKRNVKGKYDAFIKNDVEERKKILETAVKHSNSSISSKSRQPYIDYMANKYGGFSSDEDVVLSSDDILSYIEAHARGDKTRQAEIEDDLFRNLVHEVEHRERKYPDYPYLKKIGNWIKTKRNGHYTKTEASILNDLKFTDEFIKNNPEVSEVMEKSATIRDLKAKMAGKDVYNPELMKILDEKIDKLSFDDIIKLLENASGYSQNFAKRYLQDVRNGKLTKHQVENRFKNLMKKIPAAGVPYTVAKTSKNNDYERKN